MSVPRCGAITMAGAAGEYAPGHVNDRGNAEILAPSFRGSRGRSGQKSY